MYFRKILWNSYEYFWLDSSNVLTWLFITQRYIISDLGICEKFDNRLKCKFNYFFARDKWFEFNYFRTRSDEMCLENERKNKLRLARRIWAVAPWNVARDIFYISTASSCIPAAYPSFSREAVQWVTYNECIRRNGSLSIFTFDCVDSESSCIIFEFCAEDKSRLIKRFLFLCSTTFS